MMTPKPHYLLIFIFALLLRLGVLYELRNVDPIQPGMDQRGYYAEALAWPSGWPPPAPYFSHPLMPVLYLFAFKLFGVSTLAPRLLNCVLGALACPIVAAAGRRLFTPAIGLLAGWLLALYQGEVFFSTTLLDVSATTLAFALALWAVACPDARSAFIAGLVLALAVLGRGLLQATIAGLAVWWLLQRRWPAALALTAAAAAVLLPIVARNAYYGQATVMTNSSLNLWVGNNPEADGTYNIYVGGRAHDITVAVQNGDGDYTAAVLRYIKAQPFDWLRLTAQKAALLLFMPDLVLDNDVSLIGDGLRYSWILRFLPGYGLLGVFAFGGLFIFRARWREFLPLAAVYGPYAVATVVFFIAARFRAPLMVVMVFPAALLVQDVADKVALRIPGML
jgi:hypothetical protein